MTDSALLSQILTRSLILHLAGERYFERGVGYFQQGRVTELVQLGNSIEAIVEGTEEYVVKLTATAEGLEHDCNCPLGLDDEFCKHCVAVALAWLDAQSTPPKSPSGSGRAVKATGTAPVTGEDIAAVLDATDKATLVKLLLEWSKDDTALREKLVRMAALRKGPEASLALARKALEKTIRTRRFVEYREMHGYAAQIDAAIDLAEELLKSGQAAGVIELCETGVGWLSSAIEQVDDSDGYMSPLLERLQDLHLQACMEARPDPVALARRLFQAELKGGFGEWHDAAETYPEVLGREGLAVYWNLAEAAWAKLPVKTERGGHEDEEGRYAITGIMESRARKSGNVEDMVGVLERDLSYASSYERIAAIYRQAGQRDKALEWAEQGMKAFPGYEGAGLRMLVAEEYLQCQRHADALRIVWIEFRDSPDLGRYKNLEKFARAAEDWEDWRSQALAHARKTCSGGGARSAKEGAFFSSWRFQRQDRSLLVEIFLHEGRVEEAWAEAQGGGCDDRLWLRLAELRRQQHPDDAQAVYLRLAEQSIQRATGDYSDGVSLLEQAAAAARASGKSAEFAGLLDRMLVQFKAKRNFVKRVAARREFLQ
ncbi:MAG: DUF6880 family protein [Terracidiphilus sp.]